MKERGWLTSSTMSLVWDWTGRQVVIGSALSVQKGGRGSRIRRRRQSQRGGESSHLSCNSAHSAHLSYCWYLSSIVSSTVNARILYPHSAAPIAYGCVFMLVSMPVTTLLTSASASACLYKLPASLRPDAHTTTGQAFPPPRSSRHFSMNGTICFLITSVSG